MSYTPKQGNSSGSGGGNVNPNQINQQTKATLAGIANMQQQMQNLVNQSPQTPSLNAFFNLQQQNLIKQQMILQNTQFLQQLQQQQQQQQTQPPIQQNLPGKEPLALTRTPNAAEILNKTFQQQANGSAVGANLQNVAQFSQHLQAFGPNTANLMQQLQAYQYQIQQQNQPQHQSHQQQNKMQQQPYVQQNTTGHHNQQQYQQNYQQQQKFSAPSSSSQQNLPSAQQQQSHQQQQQSINKSNQNLGNQITKPPNLPAATQITPIPPPSVSTSQQQSNNSQNKNQTKPQVTMTPTTIGKSSSQHSSNKPAGASSSFMANRTIANPYAKGAHGLYQNTSTLNFKTGSSKLPPPTQITAVPLTKPTIATSSPIKTSMPTGSNASSPRSGHTPPAVNIPPKSITPPVSIIPSSVTPLPPKGVSITPGKPQTGHPIPTAIPAPIPAAVVAASATSILTVPPPIQPSVHQVTPEVLLTSTVCAQKSSSPPKLTDVPIASKGENLLQINKETSTAPSSKTESSDIKIEDAAKDKKNNEEKKQEKDKFEEKQNNITESKSKNETITESKNVDLKTTEIESSVSKDSPKDCEKSENKKENERNANKQNESKTEVVPKDNKEKSTSEIKTQEKDKKTEIKQLETKELPKTQDASSKIEEKKASISENVQTNNKKEDDILPEKKSDNEKISPKNTLLPLDKVVQKTSDKQVGSGLEKSVEKPIEKEENSSYKIISKTAKKETTNTIKPLGKSGEKDNDKNVITSPSEHVVKKQEESSQKEEKSIDNNITEVTEEKSQKIEKNTSTIRNTQQQQQKSKSLDSSKVDKHKTDSKKKNSSTNNTTVKDNPIRAKLTKSTAISVDKERSSIKEPESSKQTTDNSNLTDLKDKGNSSDTNKIENANSQSTPVKIPQENLSEVVKSSSNTETPKDETGSSRSKRHRLKTILYQSPLPELAFITKLSASEASNSPKPGSANEDKLVLFYKNEYLAVRNAEGGFFLCQALHNVYKTSPRIRIRWLSEEKSEKSIYIPDFYDNTDIECVLTTVDLNKVSRDRFKLPEHEKDRIENILKKAIDVEKGILPRPDITEENPDGLDISLYTDESQIEKKKRNSKSPRRNSQSKKVASSSKKKSKSKSPSKSKSNAKRKRNDNDTDNSEEDDEEENNDKEYKPSHKKRIVSENQEDQTIRRLQRSPLAKARAASPITLRKQTLKSVPQKSSESTPSSRESRAAKRRATDSGNEDATPNKKAALTPSKKPSDKKISNKKEENEDPLSLPESGQNAKSGNLKKSKTTTSVTSSSSSPVSEKAPNNSTSSTPTGAVRTTRSRK